MEEEASFSFGGWIKQDSGFLPRHLFLKVTLSLCGEGIGEFPSLYGSLWSKPFLHFTSVSLWTWQNRLLRNTLEGIWTIAVHLFFMVLDCKSLRLVKHQRTSQRGNLLFQKVSSCIKHYGISCYGISSYFTTREKVSIGTKNLLVYIWGISPFFIKYLWVLIKVFFY